MVFLSAKKVVRADFGKFHKRTLISHMTVGKLASHYFHTSLLSQSIHALAPSLGFVLYGDFHLYSILIEYRLKSRGTKTRRFFQPLISSFSIDMSSSAQHACVTSSNRDHLATPGRAEELILLSILNFKHNATLRNESRDSGGLVRGATPRTYAIVRRRIKRKADQGVSVLPVRSIYDFLRVRCLEGQSSPPTNANFIFIRYRSKLMYTSKQ
jgi:hypothetical protein